MVPYISKQKSDGFDVHAPPWRGRRRRGCDERGADLDDAAALVRRSARVNVCRSTVPMLVDEDAVHLETEERGF